MAGLQIHLVSTLTKQGGRGVKGEHSVHGSKVWVSLLLQRMCQQVVFHRWWNKEKIPFTVPTLLLLWGTLSHTCSLILVRQINLFYGSDSLAVHRAWTRWTSYMTSALLSSPRVPLWLFEDETGAKLATFILSVTGTPKFPWGSHMWGEHKESRVLPD